jgi:hypothetical protein
MAKHVQILLFVVIKFTKIHGQIPIANPFLNHLMFVMPFYDLLYPASILTFVIYFFFYSL